MTCLHNNEVKNIAECNLLYDIINRPKRGKKLNSHYSHIIHGCMNTGKGKANFKNFHILLDSGCSSTIVIRRIVENLGPEKYAPMQWHTQAVNITTNIKVKVDFTLPELSMANVVTWKFHVDDSTKGRYAMILGQDVLT